MKWVLYLIVVGLVIRIYSLYREGKRIDKLCKKIDRKILQIKKGIEND